MSAEFVVNAVALFVGRYPRDSRCRTLAQRLDPASNATLSDLTYVTARSVSIWLNRDE